MSQYYLLCFYSCLFEIYIQDINNKSVSDCNKIYRWVIILFFERMTSDTRRTGVKICLASSISKFACRLTLQS